MTPRAFLDLVWDGPAEAVLAALRADPALAAAADPDHGDAALSTAISRRDDPELVEALLAAGADLHALVPAAGAPAWVFARSVAVAEVCDRHGARWEEHGGAALALAASRTGTDRALGSWLLDRGAVPTGAALHGAARAGDGSLARLVAAAAPEERAEALYRSVLDEDLDATLRLVDAGADPAHAEAVAMAAGLGQLEILDLLLSRGADPDAPTTDGDRPLVDAAFEGQLGAVARLLAAGADPSLANAHGQTATDGADAVGDPALIALLARSRG